MSRYPGSFQQDIGGAFRRIQEQLDAATKRAEVAEGERDKARKTSAYWKGENIAGNKVIDALEAENAKLRGLLGVLPTELRYYWSFDNGQRHTHTWHDREDYIDNLVRRTAALKEAP